MVGEDAEASDLMLARGRDESDESGACVSPCFALSTLFVLGLSECAIRCALPSTAFRDPDSDVFWILRLRDAPPMKRMYGSDAVFDDELGWRMKPNFVGENIHANSRGVRGEREQDAVAALGTLRIVTIGDSFSWGFGGGDDETYSARLEALLPATEVINLGVNGYGTDQQVLAWERDGISYQPDVVVLGFFIHNFHRNGQSVLQFPKPYFLRDPDAPDGFRLNGVPVVRIEEIFDDESSPSRGAHGSSTRRASSEQRSRGGWDGSIQTPTMPARSGCSTM